MHWLEINLLSLVPIPNANCGVAGKPPNSPGQLLHTPMLLMMSWHIIEVNFRMKISISILCIYAIGCLLEAFESTKVDRQN